MTGWRSNWREHWRSSEWTTRGERLLAQLRRKLDDDGTFKSPTVSEVHAAHQRVWAALDELVSALDAMPSPPPGRLADAIGCAREARDRSLPW